MNSLPGFGKILVFFGCILIVTGLLFMLAAKFTSLGKLPGDIQIHKKGLDIYIPLASSLIISILLTVILNIFSRK